MRCEYTTGIGHENQACLSSPSSLPCSLLLLSLQEYKRKQIEEQRQAERLQRQLQQERAYLVSLQQQQQQQEGRQAEKKQLYHYKDIINPNDKPAWAKEVSHNIHDGERPA